jgi:hypothetical protein
LRFKGRDRQQLATIRVDDLRIDVPVVSVTRRHAHVSPATKALLAAIRRTPRKSARARRP